MKLEGWKARQKTGLLPGDPGGKHLTNLLKPLFLLALLLSALKRDSSVILQDNSAVCKIYTLVP
jgi:hypothetical protein